MGFTMHTSILYMMCVLAAVVELSACTDGPQTRDACGLSQHKCPGISGSGGPFMFDIIGPPGPLRCQNINGVIKT